MSLYEIDTATRFTIIDALVNSTIHAYALRSQGREDLAALNIDALRAIDAHTSADALASVLSANQEFSVRA